MLKGPERGGGLLLRSTMAAVIAVVVLAGTETVVAYPRPSAASGAFFFFAALTYLPLALIAAALLIWASPARGVDLWFPLLVGTLRLYGPVVGALASGAWGTVLGLAIALGIVLAIRSSIESPTHSPPFLFGLTVGIVLPILTARVAKGILSERVGGAERALLLGTFLGILTFVLLRAFVARWPKVVSVFLLGPIVSLGAWNRSGASRPRALPAAQDSGAVSRPDLLLIVLDTVRAQALASYGYTRNTMPNLERFARSATTFSRAWTNGSWTLPAHASLFSGLRLTRHRYDSGFETSGRSSPDSFLAARLRRSGYETGAVAANFGVFGREDALLGGFDSVDAEPLRPFAFRPWLFDLLASFPRAPWLRMQAARFPGPSMRAPWAVERGLRFWSHSNGRPRFLFVNLMEAHLPWIPEAEDLGRFGPTGLDVESEQEVVLGRYLHGGRPTVAESEILRARYDESLFSLDRSLGRLLDGLGTTGPGRGPIVVITSDHGESFGEHDRYGHRNSVDEAATRIPLFVRDPSLGAGERRDTPVQLVDIFHHLARAAGLPIEPGLDAQGFGERRYAVIEHRPGPQGTLPQTYPRGDLSALVDWPYKLVEGAKGESALFNLESDPTEEVNLIRHFADRAATMQGILREVSTVPSNPRVAPDRASEERLKALGYVR